jgi:hypothetical protein
VEERCGSAQVTGTCCQAEATKGVVDDSPRDISRRMTKLCNPPMGPTYLCSGSLRDG